MINLDEHNQFAAQDPDGMLAQIDGLPDQLQNAYQLGKSQPLAPVEGLKAILIAGMGGSAIGADLLSAYVAPLCPVPVIVHRDYDLPAWASGPQVLVIASSHSGNTEETLSAYDQARANGCSLLAISTGGKLAERAQAAGISTWHFDHRGQPRAAVGFSFGLLLAAFVRMGLVPEQETLVREAVAEMKRQQETIGAESPLASNIAKRNAGQIFGRWVSIFGAGYTAPVARRWKGQVSELAKAWGQFEALPEADHNTLAGLLNPEQELAHLMALFLRAPSDDPRNRLRADLTRQSFMQEGLNTDTIDAQGNSPLAHIWTLLHMGDYTAYYLAMLYGVDPTPVAAIEGFKREMKNATG